MKRTLVVMLLFMCLSASFGLVMGCSGDSSGPTVPEEGKCLEVAKGNPLWPGALTWDVSLKNKATGEVLTRFSIISTSACMSNLDGEQIACYKDVVVENDQIVSFNATIGDENYNYPADAC